MMTSDPCVHCQCTWQPHYASWGQFIAFTPCFEAMTQEDLLCDWCRERKASVHGHWTAPAEVLESFPG